MKKIFLAVSAVFLLQNTGVAQLTLTQAMQEPIVGNLNYIQEYDSVSAIPKSTGINQNWNFSTLNQTTVTSTSSFVAASSVPSASNYPGATLAENLGGGEYNFFKSSTTPTTQFEYLGTLDTNFPATGVKFSNSAINTIWPLTAGATFSDTFSGTFIGQSGSVTGTQTITSSGSGNITLPGGKVYSDIVQVTMNQKMVSTLSIFTISITFTTNIIEYRYYHPTQKFPLLSVSYDITGDGTFADTTVTIKLNKTITVGLKDQKFDANYSVFPNPTKDNFTISLSNKNNENGQIELYSQTGQLVKVVKLGNSAEIKEQVSVSELSPGIYFLKTSLGDQSSVKKLIVE